MIEKLNMSNRQDISKLIQCHSAIDHFNYDLVVDWAIDLISDGVEFENVFILASFSKPVDSYEFKPYLKAAFIELELDEKSGEEAVLGYAHFYLSEILNDHSIRNNLYKLSELCIQTDYGFSLEPFYYLHFGWEDLDYDGSSYHYSGVDYDNIEDEVKVQAQIWIDKYIYKKVSADTNSKPIKPLIKNKESSFWSWLKRIFD